MPRMALFLLVALLSCGSVSAQSNVPASLDDPASVGTLWHDLGRDFRNLPSIENGIVLGAGGALSAWVHSEDGEITHEWSTSEELDEVFESGGTLGSGWVQIGGAIGTYVIGRRMGSPRIALLGADLIRSQTINSVLTQSIKLAVRRERPDGANFSFPSGHASATFATATVLQRNFGWKVGAPAYAVAAFVGGSRLQENRHYLSDVVFGAAIGIVSGRTTTIGRGAERFALSPLVAPGTVGIALTRLPHQ